MATDIYEVTVTELVHTRFHVVCGSPKEAVRQVATNQGNLTPVDPPYRDNLRYGCKPAWNFSREVARKLASAQSRTIVQRTKK